jgi:streptogramin lyase
MSRFSPGSPFGNGRKRMGQRKTRRPRLCLEVLEDRSVPAVSISIADASLNEIGMASALVSSGSGGLSAPKDVVQGPDGNIYVASSGTNSILRYNGSTGAFISTFVASGSGGLSSPYGVAFGPDGNLYVGSTALHAINRYNGTTGAFIDAFVPANSGGLTGPKCIAFGADGNLYVADSDSNAVLRYQGPSGASPGTPLPSTGQTGATFVPAGSGGLSGPFELAFGPDGNLYVNNTANSLAVLKFDGATGAFISTYVPPGSGGLLAPRGLAFDQDGRLYVTDVLSNAVHRYDSVGQYLDDPVVGAPNSVIWPIGLAFDTQGRLLITGRDSNAVVRYDRGVTATLSAASATPVSVSYATSAGSATAGSDYTTQAGTVMFSPGQTSRLILLATHDDVQLESNETFSVQLSNPTGGATIGTGTATATIVDDDSTRQITISDSTATEGDNMAKFLDAFVSPGIGGLGAPGGFAFGPDGNFYVASGSQVLRYNGTTGAFMNIFVPTGTGGTRNGAFELLFMPGGDLLVAYQNSNEVLRFNGTTGAYLGNFTSGRTLSFPRALAFGPDGSLYVNSQTGSTSEIDRFDGTTGAFLGVFATANLINPQGMVFGPDGNLYVTEPNSHNVLRFNGTTGANMGYFTGNGSGGLDTPRKLAFGPDGNLYVADSGSGSTDLNIVDRFDGTTGAFLDTYVPSRSSAPDDLFFLAFGPDGNLYVGSQGEHSVLRYGAGSQEALTVSLSTASSLPLTVDFATSNGSAVAGSDYLSKSGTVTFDAGATSRGILIATLDDTSVEPSETINVTLSNPVGATIADGLGVSTILDDDGPAKFYVVNDAVTRNTGYNATFEYQTSGALNESYSLNRSNLSPVGAAANAAGTRIWVLDGNGTVYVYDTSGGLLGSWSAGGGLIQPQGITVWNNDLWIVDRDGSGTVYKYAGGATRLSGSQNPASSFTLATGKNPNSNATGIVTDGTYFWVVNDGLIYSKDSVFKYTLSGTLKGSWQLDRANAQPTGLTINPNSPSDIWVVDSGTKTVYKYANAVGKTSGSQSAASSFALAANNTNPQDIADPPPLSTLPVPSPTILAPVPAAQPAPLVSPAAGRDAFFALLDNAPPSGSVNSVTQHPPERNVVATVPPVVSTPSARIDLVFAGSEQETDAMIADGPLFPDPEGAELITADWAG